MLNTCDGDEKIPPSWGGIVDRLLIDGGQFEDSQCEY